MTNTLESDNYIEQENEFFKEEMQDLAIDISSDYLPTRKEIHHNFCEYAQELLTPEEQQDVLDMFGGKDLKGAINNFLKEKRKAVQASEQKSDQYPDGDYTLLNSLNLTMLFLGNVNINGLLNTYYDDFVTLRSAKKGTERDTVKSQLVAKYDLSKKNDDQKKQYISTQRQNFSQANTTNGLDNTNTTNKSLVGVYNRYNEEEKDIKAGKILPKNVAKIQSCGAIKIGDMTYCARTAKQDAKSLFHLNLQGGNAIDAMRANPQGGCKKSIVSNIFKKKEGNDAGKSVHHNDDLGKSDYINQQADGCNFADLYVTSSTANGRKYGHRATMFAAGGLRYVLDPYTAMTKGTATNSPIPLERYKEMMDHGTNHREFMRMNFYNSPIKIDGTLGGNQLLAGPSSNKSSSIDTDSAELIGSLYNNIENKEGLSQNAFETAYTAYMNAKEKIKNHRYLTVVDYSMPNTSERLFVIDLQSNKVVLKSQAGHGMKSGTQSNTESFSNKVGSQQSSPGLFMTAAIPERNSKNTWTGLRLIGLEPGINDQSDERGIFIHYRKNIYGGEGCITITEKNKADQINNILAGGCPIYSYTEKRNYLAGSKLLKTNTALAA